MTDDIRPTPADMPGAVRPPLTAIRGEGRSEHGPRQLFVPPAEADAILRDTVWSIPAQEMTVATSHEVRCAPSDFAAIWSGRKPFDVRWNDRGYQAGDHLVLREYDRFTPCLCDTGTHPPGTCARYTGRLVHTQIGFVTTYIPGRGPSRPAFEGRGWAVLSLVDMQLVDVTDNQDGPTPAGGPR